MNSSTLSLSSNKPPIESAKLGGAYGLFLSSFLLQLQDPERKWTWQAILSNVLVFISMMLTKAYGVNSECNRPEPRPETHPSEPTMTESRGSSPP